MITYYDVYLDLLIGWSTLLYLMTWINYYDKINDDEYYRLSTYDYDYMTNVEYKINEL